MPELWNRKTKHELTIKKIKEFIKPKILRKTKFKINNMTDLLNLCLFEINLFNLNYN